jgi:uncharacterized protein (TIGR00369 family)
MGRGAVVAELVALNRVFAKHIALNQAMGLEIEEFGDGVAILRMPWDDRFIGDPTTGAMHGGAITVLMDAACGAAAFLGLPRPDAIATLDLRIDFLRSTIRGEALVCRAECYKCTRSVAFIRASAYQEDPDDPVAAATATFMIGTHIPVNP